VALSKHLMEFDNKVGTNSIFIWVVKVVLNYNYTLLHETNASENYYAVSEKFLFKYIEKRG